MRVWLLALLLIPIAGSQEFATEPLDTTSVHAPVQLLLDQFPALMNASIVEATRDGTPDQANKLLADMEAFFSVFEGQAAWPATSVAGQSTARQVYASVAAIIATAATLPDTVAQLAIPEAQCNERAGVGTQVTVTEWWAAAATAVDELDFARGSLLTFADSLPEPLDDTPVRSAVEHMEAWLIDSAVSVEICLQNAFIILGAPESFSGLGGWGDLGGGGARIQDLLEARGYGTGAIGAGGISANTRLDIRPSRAHLGEEVVIGGRFRAPAGAVLEITSSFGWSIQHTLHLGGFFSINATIPPNTALGTHDVQARIGVLDATTEVEVVKAPTTIDFTGIRVTSVGRSYPIAASVESPLPLPPNATMTFHDQQGPASGTGLRLQAPDDPGSTTFTATYDGDAQHDATSAQFTVRFQEIRERELGDTDAWDVLEKGVWFAPTETTQNIEVRFVAQEDDATELIVVASTLGFFVLVDLAVASRRPPTLTRLDGVPGPAPRLRWPRSFLRAFARVAEQLISSGKIRRGATVRDVSRHLAKQRIQAGELVDAFEASRYGPARDEEEGKRASWLLRAWRRL